MRRVLVAAVLVLGVLPAVPARGAPACTPPEPRIVYDDERFVAVLRVDYRGCRWWKGSSIELEGEATHEFAVINEGMFAYTGCGLLVAGPKGSKPKNRTLWTCSLRLPFDHPPLEIGGHYYGEFTYRWKGGSERAAFDVTCSTFPSPSCSDT